MKDLLWPIKVSQSIPSNGRMGMSATIKLDGSLGVSIPGVLRGGPEIGYYVHNIGARRVREFRALIEQQKLWELPGIRKLAPEQPSVKIMAGEYGAKQQSVMWAIGGLPPEALVVMDAFNKLVDEAYASPREVLRGEARWSAPNFSAREPLQLEFTLRNKGTDAITVKNFMAAREGASPLKLVVFPPLPPDGERPSPTWITITPAMLSRPDLSPRASAGQQDARFELAPGQSLRFAATPSAYLSPAEHQAVLILDNGSPSNGCGNLIYGVLAMEMPPLHIVHRG